MRRNFVMFVSIYWDSYLNDFTDIDGNINLDILRMVNPNRMLMMRQKRGYWYETYKGVTYELVFPLEDDEEDLQ
jgi:hypothetical protein